MSRAHLLSVLDQAVLSGLSLLLGLLLIKLGTPEALGRFTLALAVFFMCFSIKYALVVLPISTRVFGASEGRAAEVIGIVAALDLVVILISVLLSLVVLAAFGFAPIELIAAAAMIAAGLWRELGRTIHIARGHMGACLALDTAGTLVTLLSLGGYWHLFQPEVACLLALATGSAVAGAAFSPPLFLSRRHIVQNLLAYRQFLPQTRWAFLGGIAAELQARGYVFGVQVLRGVAANGMLQASRIVLSPIEMIGIAWGRVSVPRLAALVRAGRTDEAWAATRLNVMLMAGFALCYLLAVLLVWGWIESLVFGTRYPRMWEMVVAWGGFALVASGTRCLEWMFQAMERYRELAVLGLVNSACIFVLLGFLALPVPLYCVLGILGLGQVFVFASLAWLGSAPRWRGRQALQ